jgi:luciferase family oxidoreductase group 1
MSNPLDAVSFSVLDLAPYPEGQTIADAFRNSRDLAQHAEEWGYHRYWIAEHHNIEGIASSATPILLGYVAEATRKIRIGSGGIMLPNHPPLIVAEQFGTLETLYPKRIDLGLGRAPGTDQQTMRAIRRESPTRGDDFSELIEELEFFFAEAQPGQKVKAIPGAGMNIPLWILGSSLYSAELAARLGRPYAFAGHFAPKLMWDALKIYRENFKPSVHLEKPKVMVGVSVVAAETTAKAEFLATTLYQQFLGMVRGMRTQAKPPVPSMDSIWSPPEEMAVKSMLSTLIVGDAAGVRLGLEKLQESTKADEIIMTSHLFHHEDRLKSYEIIAKSVGISR